MEFPVLGLVPGLEWVRPAGLWAFVLPLALWVLLRWNTRPPEEVTGTASLWSALDAQAQASRRFERRRLPPWALFLLAAMGVGILAFAGPRTVGTPPPRTWRVQVDASPSMGLPGTGDALRRAEGVARARALVGDVAGPFDRVVWSSAGRRDLELAPGEAPPDPWTAPLAWVAAEPDWVAHDLGGVLFVTDVLPEPAPERAGWVQTGARPTPGRVDVVTTGEGEPLELRFDGTTLVEAGAVVPAGQVRLEPAPGLEAPPALERVLDAWRQARGFAYATSDSSAPRLVVRLEDAGAAAHAGAVGRDGWRAEARWGPGLSPLEDPLPETTWLEGPRGEPLVRVAPGRLRLALAELLEPHGDPASFAVSWARLFDEAVLPFEGAVPLSERLLQGEASQRPPSPLATEPTTGKDEPPPSSIDAWLAALSGVLALAALTLRFDSQRALVSGRE